MTERISFQDTPKGFMDGLMKTIKVTYTVQSAFVSRNLANIQAFLNDVRNITDADIRYMVYLREDGKTFMHLASYDNEASQKRLLELASFKSFQQQRDASGLEVLPKIEMLQAVASSYEVFSGNQSAIKPDRFNSTLVKKTCQV